jgi:hypothetical protein
MTTELAPRPIEGEYRIVRPLVSKEAALAAWQEYQDLTRAILRAADFQTFREGGREGRFVKKSGWRRLATHYGISLEMVDERLGHEHEARICARVRFPEQMREDRDCGCAVVFARYVVKAVAPNGRSVTAIGLCSTGEKNRRFVRQDHDIATTAYTRAANRAISDMIGAGEISAEEVRATGEFAGISLEERAAVKAAWAGAPQDRRSVATSWLRAAGFTGETVSALFSDFARRAADAQVEDLIGQLAGVGADFDPDAILEEAEATA